MFTNYKYLALLSMAIVASLEQLRVIININVIRMVREVL
jgi:hypothetical protein